MKPTIFCLIPVKDEEWILERALKSASIWADKIIVSDQGSTDRTVEIARKFPKVTIIDNSHLKDFNEQEMRAPLFKEARKTPGKKLLVSLDADEIFTPNFDSPEWETMLNAKEGTRFTFTLLNIRPDYQSVFTTIDLTAAFMDDGSEYNVGLIHVPRQPQPTQSVYTVKLNDISILHFQFTNWERMEQKHMWYQMYERIHYPTRSVITLFRIFHYNKNFIPIHNFTQRPFEENWVDGYKKYNIDITSVTNPPSYIWEEKIIEYINENSSCLFNRIDIWDIDWEKKVSQKANINLEQFKDKRTAIDKLLLKYLKKTHDKRLKLYVRAIDKILKHIF